MAKGLLIIFLLLSSIFAGPDNNIEKVDFFEIDVQSHIYIVKGAELQKLSQKNELLYTYSNLIYGDISTLDVNKSTNIFVYYKDFNKIIFLDNTLSQKYSPIDIPKLGYPEANLACRSYNNSFWIYDPINKELLRFNSSLQNTDRTGNLYSVTNVNIDPIQIIERNNSLYLRDNANGIFVFDRYGGFLRQMPFTNIDDFYIDDNNWLMLKNDTNFVFNPISLQVDTVALPNQNIKQIRVYDNKMYYLTQSGDFEMIKI